MKKKLLIENDLPDLHDFQKILLLNKGKLDFNDVQFMDSEREGYENVIEVTKHGLLLHFDDLEQFLKFFFQETYQEGGDGEYDAMNYDRMYYGGYDFSYDCSERASDDWAEGYPLSSFCDDAMLRLHDLVEIISPQSLKYFKVNGDKIEISTSEGELTRLLSSHFPKSEDEITEIDCSARHYMLKDEASEYLGEKFCNGLKPLGIENWGRNRFTECFKTYFVSWGALVQMYIENGNFDEEALDVMFKYIERNFKDHPPVYYEIEYNIWDKDGYIEYSCKRFSDYLDELIEEARETYTPEYLKGMERLEKLGLLNNRVKLPGDNRYYIEVLNLDPETMKVKYLIHQDKWGYDRKAGLTTVDDIVAMVTQPGLFDQMDFRVNPK